MGRLGNVKSFNTPVFLRWLIEDKPPRPLKQRAWQPITCDLTIVPFLASRDILILSLDKRKKQKKQKQKTYVWHFLCGSPFILLLFRSSNHFVTWTWSRLGGLPYLETFTLQIVTPDDSVTLTSRLSNPPGRVTLSIM